MCVRIVVSWFYLVFGIVLIFWGIYRGIVYFLMEIVRGIGIVGDFIFIVSLVFIISVYVSSRVVNFVVCVVRFVFRIIWVVVKIFLLI